LCCTAGDSAAKRCTAKICVATQGDTDPIDGNVGRLVVELGSARNRAARREPVSIKV
jgi:hypothetical protein